MQHWELLLFFFVIAFIYASVGFGGGSSYLAILALYALPFKELRLIALLCNVVVVTGGTILFIKNNQVNWRKIVPLVLTSVPMAFIGATLRIEQRTFFILLGCSLLIAAVLLWVRKKQEDTAAPVKSDKTTYAKDGLLGVALASCPGCWASAAAFSFPRC